MFFICEEKVHLCVHVYYVCASCENEKNLGCNGTATLGRAIVNDRELRTRNAPSGVFSLVDGAVAVSGWEFLIA